MSQPHAIARRFTNAAITYDDNADLQARVAMTMADLIDLPSPPTTTLELGCGTGLLTLPLLMKFPDSRFTITDNSKKMLAVTKAKVERHSTAHKTSFHVHNGESRPELTYDLIAASMVIHWFDDIPAALNRICGALSPNGSFYFSTITATCFPQWQQALAENGLASGLRLPPPLPGIIHEETIPIAYKSADNFLQNLRRTGANGPRAGYTPLTPRQLRAAMTSLENGHDATVTWHIQYGRLPASG